MSNNLKCPFCGTELEFSNICGVPVCPNETCHCYRVKIPEEIWQALIDGKNAQDALTVARKLYEELALSHCELADNYSTVLSTKTPEQETNVYMKEYDEKISSLINR